MLWSDLLAEITAVGSSGSSSQPIAGIEYDSRRVRPGYVFVAMKGGTTDGNQYVEKALASGALGIITDSSQAFDHLVVYKSEVPVIEVEHGRRALAEASAAFFGHPERKLAATGITGTNGKTTTAFLTEALLNAAGRKTVLIGTIEYHVAGEVRPSLHTTPESRDLFELMAEGASRGATELVTEVSSHGWIRAGPPEFLLMSPCLPISPAITLTITTRWTSTSPPSACSSTAPFIPRPASLFSTLTTNGRPIWRKLPATPAPRSRTYGIGIGDFRAASYALTPGGATIDLESPAGSARIVSKLAGEVNILNLLAAFTAAHARGITFNELVSAVPQLKPVPGPAFSPSMQARPSPSLWTTRTPTTHCATSPPLRVSS